MKSASRLRPAPPGGPQVATSRATPGREAAGTRSLLPSCPSRVLRLEKKSLEARPRRPGLRQRPRQQPAPQRPRHPEPPATSYCGAAARSRTSPAGMELISPTAVSRGGGPGGAQNPAPRDPGVLREQCGAARRRRNGAARANGRQSKQRLCVRVQWAQSLPPPPPPPLPPPPPTPSPPPPSSTPRLPGHSIATEHGGCADAAQSAAGAAAAAAGGDLRER